MSARSSHDDQDELFHESPREGLFDAQLSFPTPSVGPPEPIARVRKRDGREAPFETTKITESIRRAAEAADQADLDRAESLASAVAIYLSKRSHSAAVDVDEVSDAVERVLMELGFGATALAYARYRDKRARMRELRQGDLHAVLHELEEARREGATGRPLSLFVRTSDDSLVAWDAERIVDALVRETGIERGPAELIALEVEGQIRSAQVRTLTASLVRELVGAKLIEHGLEEHRRRHARLGVPLFDAERIICLPNQDEPGVVRSPESTDLQIAERVKREYALTQVYGAVESEAHLRGDLYIHDLGYVDRLHATDVTLGYVERYGMPGPRSVAPQGPRHVDMFLVEAGRFAAAVYAHTAGTVRWHALNGAIAPYAESLTDESLRGLCRWLLWGLSPQPALSAGRRAGSLFDCVWPEAVHDERAGVDAWHRAAGALLEAYCEDARDGGGTARADGTTGATGGGRLLPRVRLTRATLRTESGRAFVRLAARAALSGRPVWAAFDRGEAAELTDPRFRRPVVGMVTLNLPRLAYGVGSLEDMSEALAGLLQTAADALATRRDFVDRLLSAQEFGPLALLAADRGRPALLDRELLEGRVGLTGLNECVRLLSGASFGETAESVGTARALAARAAERCATESERVGMRILAVPDEHAETARRFAAHDLRVRPAAARSVVRSDPATQDLFYTPGVQAAPMSAPSPVARARLEGGLHGFLCDEAYTAAEIDCDAVTETGLAQFLARVFETTACRQLLLTPKRGPV